MKSSRCDEVCLCFTKIEVKESLRDNFSLGELVQLVALVGLLWWEPPATGGNIGTITQYTNNIDNIANIGTITQYTTCNNINNIANLYWNNLTGPLQFRQVTLISPRLL